jgi:hypothetical protein
MALRVTMSLRMLATRRTLPGLPAAPVTAVLGLGMVGRLQCPQGGEIHPQVGYPNAIHEWNVVNHQEAQRLAGDVVNQEDPMRKFLVATAVAALLTGWGSSASAQAEPTLPAGMFKCFHTGGWTGARTQQECQEIQATMNRPTIDCRTKDGGQIFAMHTDEECEAARKNFDAYNAPRPEQKAREEAAVPPAIKAMRDELIAKLDSAKREIWSTYNDQVAMIKTQEAWVAATDGVNAWLERCSTGTYELRNGPSYAECFAAYKVLFEAVLAWDWRSPPR